MSTPALQLFFALLSLLVNAVTVLLAVALVLRRSRAARAVVEGFAPLAVPSAFLVALTATLGSLWFSEVAGFVPCKLCWYQRIAVFPLPLLLAAMLLGRDRRAPRYLLAVTVPGSAIALWHWLVERVPSLSGSVSCAVDVPCSVPWFTELGFVTLAWMALSTLSFVTVAVLCLVSAGSPRTGGSWREVADAFAAACRTDEFGAVVDVHAGDLRDALRRHAERASQGD